MARKGHYGNGTIAPSGKSTWRIRYRIEGERFAKTVKGTRTEAGRELRRLLQSGDTGMHVAPDKITLAHWIEQWLALKERATEAQTAERYATVMKVHVVPVLGSKALQKIVAIDIDRLYAALEQKLSPRTMSFLHVVLKSCLATAVKKSLLSTNPVDRAERPAPDDSKVGMVLDEEIVSRNGKHLPRKIDSLCVHGDEPTAVVAARGVRQGLEVAGVRVLPLTEMNLT